MSSDVEIQKLGETIRGMRREIDRLRAQQTQALVNRILHRCTIDRSDIDVATITTPTINYPKILGPTITVDGTGIIIKNTDDDTQPTTISKTKNTKDIGFDDGIVKNAEWQATPVASGYVGDLPTSKITSGTFDDGRIAQSNVTQHQASLAVKGSLLSDTVPDNRLPSTMSGKTFTGEVELVDTTFKITETGGGSSTITKTAGSDKLEFSGDVKVGNGEFSADTIVLGEDADHPFNLTLDPQGGGLWFMEVNTTLAASDVWLILYNYGLNGKFGLSVQNYLNVGSSEFVVSKGIGISAKNGGTINEFSTDGTFAGNSDSAVPTEKATKTYVDKIAMVGSSNAVWIPLVLEGSYRSSQTDYLVTGGDISNVGAEDMGLSFKLLYPTNRGGLKLYIDQIKILLQDADADDYIDTAIVYGLTDSVKTPLITDPGNYTSPGNHVYPAVANPVDCSSYDLVAGLINFANTTAGDSNLYGFLVHMYYA